MKAAVYCGTRNIYADMIPSLKSLLVHSDVDQVYLLIEDDEFPFEVSDCVNAVNVSGQNYFQRGGPNWFAKWTWMTMMRAALPNMFTEMDRILSIDPDAIAIEDISDVWELDLGKNFFAAVREPEKSDESFTYVNMGVCLHNLKELRSSGMTDKIIHALNTELFLFSEQDCMNKLCQGKIALMPPEYNSSAWTERSEFQKIMHFAAVKGWQSLPVVQKYREMSWSEVNEIHDTRMSAKNVVC